MTNTYMWPTARPHYATIVEVVDGDTIRCDIDMDLRVWMRYKVRLLGCNAWEASTEAGKAAKANLQTVLPPGLQVVLTLIKDYKYGGEFVAAVTMPDGTDLVSALIAGEWLAPWDGRGAMPVPPWPRTVL